MHPLVTGAPNARLYAATNTVKCCSEFLLPERSTTDAWSKAQVLLAEEPVSGKFEEVGG